MRVRRSLVATAVTSVVLGGAIVGAPSASAADVSAACNTVNGTTMGPVTGIVGIPGLSPGFNAGEVIRAKVQVFNGAPFVSLQVPVGTVRASGAAPTTLTYVAVGGETSVEVFNSGTGAFSATFSCSAPAEPNSVAPIPDWVQGYARAEKSATCIEGWEPSWEQWPNGGKGGYVCTRSVPAYGRP